MLALRIYPMTMTHALWAISCVALGVFATSGEPAAVQEALTAIADAPRGGCLLSPVVCVLQVRGEVGEAFDGEGLEAALAEAEKYAPDLIVVDIDTTWKTYRGNDRSVYTDEDRVTSGSVFGDAMTAAWALGEFMMSGAHRSKPVRTSVWVGQAVGPAGIIPLACNEVYYRSNAIHGAIAGVFQMYPLHRRAWSGMANSLPWGRIQSVALKAGYPRELVRAMEYDHIVLSYSVGKEGLRFFEDASGDTLLTDGGGIELGPADHKDTVQESLSFTGNDSLVVCGRQGVKLGLAKACVDSIDELVCAMGFEGCPDVVTIPVKRQHVAPPSTK